MKSAILTAACAAALLIAFRMDRVRRDVDRVVIVTIDRARADHLPFHGYPRPTTGFLVQLAEEGFSFERAYSSSPDLSLALDGLNIERRPGSSGAGTSLFENLRRSGYETASFTDDAGLAALHGEAVSAHSVAEEAARAAAAWVRDGARPRKIAVWLHLKGDPCAEAVMTLERLSPVGAQLRRYLVERQGLTADEQGMADNASVDRVRRHDGRIFHVDRVLGRFYSTILDRSKPTMWIATSLRGEALDGADDGIRLDEGMVRVPLIAWFSDDRNPGRRLNGTVRHPDIRATVLHLAGVSAGRRFSIHARSFASALRKKGGWSGTSDAVLRRAAGSSAIVCGSWKLVRSPAGESLFDLRSDALERRSLGTARPGLRDRLAHRLARAAYR